MEKSLVILRFKSFITTTFFIFAAANLFFAQDIIVQKQNPPVKKDEKKPEPTSTPIAPPKNSTKAVTAEQVIESSIFVYGFPGGRITLNQIRKTAIERGRISVTAADGRVDQATYQRWTLRGGNLTKEKIRLDQEFPNARYALVHSDDKIFGIFNDSVFTPREDASKAFQNQIFYGLEAFLRYKENESKIELAGREKIMGVDFHVVDVTDKQNRKIRFFVSVKTYRVMMLDYEDEGIKYRRRFYNYNYAQGTLVPFRSVLTAGNKIVEETDISTITFGQKIDEDMFKAS